MEKFTFNEIEPGFYSIEQDYVRSFMILGESEILLVDSGMGGNQLLEQVRGYSELPIKIIFTHADMDHVGDAGDFDKRYMHPSEFEYYYSKSNAPVPMEAIWEGDCVTIGKYMFEVILIPGHTPGSIGLLDRKNRILIGGDSVQMGPIFMFGPGRDFDMYKLSMEKLQGYLSEIDWIYAGHHELRVPPSTVNQLLSGATKMIAGEVEGEPEERFENKIKCYKTDGIAFFAL